MYFERHVCAHIFQFSLFAGKRKFGILLRIHLSCGHIFLVLRVFLLRRGKIEESGKLLL